ncbi:hypothetical protein KKC60_03355 [Patescibacteria group bacterium]|nr:hypothetical protein [Patescibacteria group bacterium]
MREDSFWNMTWTPFFVSTAVAAVLGFMYSRFSSSFFQFWNVTIVVTICVIGLVWSGKRHLDHKRLQLDGEDEKNWLQRLMKYFFGSILHVPDNEKELSPGQQVVNRIRSVSSRPPKNEGTPSEETPSLEEETVQELEVSSEATVDKSQKPWFMVRVWIWVKDKWQSFSEKRRERKAAKGEKDEAVVPGRSIWSEMNRSFVSVIVIIVLVSLGAVSTLGIYLFSNSPAEEKHRQPQKGISVSALHQQVKSLQAKILLEKKASVSRHEAFKDLGKLVLMNTRVVRSILNDRDSTTSCFKRRLKILEDRPVSKGSVDVAYVQRKQKKLLKSFLKLKKKLLAKNGASKSAIYARNFLRSLRALATRVDTQKADMARWKKNLLAAKANIQRNREEVVRLRRKLVKERRLRLRLRRELRRKVGRMVVAGSTVRRAKPRALASSKRLRVKARKKRVAKKKRRRKKEVDDGNEGIGQ